MQVSEKPKMLVSFFPSGRSVATILLRGQIFRTVQSYSATDFIKKMVAESDAGLEVTEKIWDEILF
jgi:hypothetical protein